jgi:hypothetical protein
MPDLIPTYDPQTLNARAVLLWGPCRGQPDEYLPKGEDIMTDRKLLIVDASAFISRRGKVVLSMLIAASALALIGISDASASCSQQFVNTTCDWRGANCVNHFKNVCTNAPVLAPIRPIAAAPIIRPQIGMNGNGLVSAGGGNLVSAGGGNLVSAGGGNMRR